MGFFDKTFGNSTDGYRAGGFLSTLLGLGVGFYFGGGIGAGIGLLGGALLGSTINETFFQVSRMTGNVEPKPRNTDIKPLEPTRDLPAPVIQPDETFSATSIKAPILANLTEPPPLAIQESFNKREAIWELLATGRNASLERFETLQKEALDLERRTDQFIATADKYLEIRTSYMDPEKGQRAEVIRAVTTSMERKGIRNPLSAEEIEMFVPSLPDLPPVSRARVESMMAEALPETLNIPGFMDNYPLMKDMHECYLAETDKTKKWEELTKLEKLNYTLDRFDKRRFQYQIKSPIDWGVAFETTDQAEIERLQNKPSAELLRLVNEKVASFNLRPTEHIESLKQLARLQRLVPMIYIRDQVKSRVEQNLGGVIDIYATFKRDHLTPATELAHEFSESRLEIFNQTGIAVLKKGKLDIAHSPDGQECTYITYKDCTSAKDSKPITLVMQKGADDKFYVTHRLEGHVVDGVDWSRAQLTGNGVEVNQELFTRLKAANIAESFKQLTLDAAKQPLLLSMSKPLEEFEASRPEGITRLAFAEAHTTHGSQGATQAIPQKIKEKESAHTRGTPELIA